MAERAELLVNNVAATVTAVITEEDFDRICRCCLSEGDLVNIFEFTYKDVYLVQLYSSLCSLKVAQNDDLPQGLCQKCIGRFIRIYEFRNTCVANEAALRAVADPQSTNQTSKVCVTLDSSQGGLVCSEQFELKTDVCAEPDPVEIKPDLNELSDVLIEHNYYYKIHHSAQPSAHSRESPPPDYQLPWYTCEICNKVMRTKVSFNRHKVLHEPPQYLCNECGKRFHYRFSLVKHSSVHTGEMRYFCDYCGKRFRLWSALKMHVEGTHLDRKPHKCEVCGKRFKQKKHLNLHSRVHTGEKPFPCPSCDKQFSYKCNLEVHLKTHPGEEPYLCDVCPKRYCTATSLRYHKKVEHDESALEVDQTAAVETAEVKILIENVM